MQVIRGEMTHYERYTLEEDTLIAATQTADERRGLASKLGRGYDGVCARWLRLRRVKAVNATVSKPKLERKALARPPFARPAWFEEDLSTLSRVAHYGR